MCPLGCNPPVNKKHIRNMIIEEIKKIKSGRRDLRNFGITIGVAAAVVGSLLFWRGREHYFYFLSCALLFFGLGIFFPLVLKPIQKIWMSLSVLMGWFMTRVILTIVFCLVVVPLGILIKILGKDLLNIKLDKSADSYWVNIESVCLDKQNYENQF